MQRTTGFVLAIVLFSATFLTAQTHNDTLRLRQLYGETEAFDAAIKQQALIGTDAPFILATTPDNDEYTSNNLSDKVVLVHFWFLTCGGCLKENPILNKINDTLKINYHFKILAFANNTNEELRHFLIRDSLYFGNSWQTIKKHPKLHFPIIADANEQVFNDFRGWSYPANILIDRNGIIRKIIYRHELDMTDQEFLEYMLAQIQELLNE